MTRVTRMNRNDARVCLDGANAFLQHTPMKIRELTKIRKTITIEVEEHDGR